MKLTSKIVLTLVVLIGTLNVLNEAFGWMNQSSNLYLYGGLSLVVLTIIAVPNILNRIWKEQKPSCPATEAIDTTHLK